MLASTDLPQLGDDVEALHFGAISLIPEPCGSAYEALLVREADRRIISLDPNIRANFIPDANSHRQRMHRMIAKSDIIKVSDEDLAWLEPDRDADAAIEDWIAGGAAIIVVTRGAQGASATTMSGTIDVPSQRIEVVDTVGAGDSFDAGFLAGVRQAGRLSKTGLRAISADELKAALHLAASVAAITVSRAGANPPWKHELG